MQQQLRDPGFGKSYTVHTKRIINPDGSFNVVKKGVKFTNRDFYLYLVNMSWYWFIAFLFGLYGAINAIFALIYVAIGVEDLSGAPGSSFGESFLHAFYFSSQTFTTVGYGAISPQGHMASLVASVEGMVGLCGFAFATGLLWGRFSKPNIRLAFSKNVLVAPYKGGKAIMFRLANGRENALMEPEIIVSLTRETKQSDGTFKREYFRMNLELAKISYLPLTWTIVHPIDRESPFENWTRQDFESIDGEILIIFKAFDETYSNVVHKRYSYLLSDVVYNAQFKRAFYGAESGEVIVDLDRISDFEPIR